MNHKLIVALASFLFTFSALNASSLTIQFEGQLHKSNWQKFKKDTPFKGELIVNQELQNTVDPQSLSSVLRLLLKNPSQFTLQIGDHKIESNNTPEMLVEIVNDHGSRKSDHFLIRSYQNSLDKKDFGSQLHVSLQLDSNSGKALNSRQIPDQLNLSEWSQDFGLTISYRPQDKQNNRIGADSLARGQIQKIIIKKGENTTPLNLVQIENSKKMEKPQNKKSFSFTNWASGFISSIIQTVKGWFQ